MSGITIKRWTIMNYVGIIFAIMMGFFAGCSSLDPVEVKDQESDKTQTASTYQKFTSTLYFYQKNTRSSETGYFAKEYWDYDAAFSNPNGFRELVWVCKPKLSVNLPYWTNVVKTYKGSLFYYNATNGVGATDRGTISGFLTGWTHIVPVRDQGLFFYRKTDGCAAMARVDGNGNYQFVRNLSGFGTSSTHIVGTQDGALLFYNANDRTAQTSKVDYKSLEYHYTSNIKGFSYWTHIASVRYGYIVFYNSETGNAWCSYLNEEGKYSSIGGISGLSPGADLVIGSGSYVIFIDNDKLRVEAVDTFTRQKISIRDCTYPKASYPFDRSWSHVVGH